MEINGINPIAVAIAAVAGCGFGALYYSILGPAWRFSAGISKDQAASPKDVRLIIRALLCQLILAVTLAILVGPFPNLEAAMQIGFVLAVGVIATTMTVNHGYQGKPLSLTFLDSAHWFGVLTVQSIVLAQF